jgi:hypothetical protein
MPGNEIHPVMTSSRRNRVRPNIAMDIIHAGEVCLILALKNLVPIENIIQRLSFNICGNPTVGVDTVCPALY